MRCTLTVVLVALALAPATAIAQGDNEFTGKVTDSTDSILIGVTVEASSPAITAPRVVFTDGSGCYTLVDLVPGVYTLRFELDGFRPHEVERELIGSPDPVTIDVQLTLQGREDRTSVIGEMPSVGVIVGPRRWTVPSAPSLPPRVRHGITITNTVEGGPPPDVPNDAPGRGITITNTVEGGPPPDVPNDAPRRGITITNTVEGGPPPDVPNDAPRRGITIRLPPR